MTALNELYRNTTLGNLLRDTLDEMVDQRQFSTNLATKVFVQFDRAMANALASRAKSRITFRAEKLVSYRYYDNVWQMHFKNMEFREFNQLSELENVKFVGCNSAKGDTAATDRARH